MAVAAIPTQSLGPIGGPTNTGLGPFSNLFSQDKYAAATGIVNGISSLIGFLTIVAAIWFLFQILFAGYQWITAGGDPKHLQEARDRIVHAFIGIVIVIAAWSLLAVVGQFFGFNSLVNPTDLINNLTIH
jgi:hypothetical protein